MNAAQCFFFVSVSPSTPPPLLADHSTFLSPPLKPIKTGSFEERNAACVMGSEFICQCFI